jgi:hypothetical protein
MSSPEKAAVCSRAAHGKEDHHALVQVNPPQDGEISDGTPACGSTNKELRSVPYSWEDTQRQSPPLLPSMALIPRGSAQLSCFALELVKGMRAIVSPGDAKNEVQQHREKRREMLRQGRELLLSTSGDAGQLKQSSLEPVVFEPKTSNATIEDVSAAWESVLKHAEEEQTSLSKRWLQVSELMSAALANAADIPESKLQEQLMNDQLLIQPVKSKPQKLTPNHQESHFIPSSSLADAATSQLVLYDNGQADCQRVGTAATQLSRVCKTSDGAAFTRRITRTEHRRGNGNARGYHAGYSSLPRQRAHPSDTIARGTPVVVRRRKSTTLSASVHRPAWNSSVITGSPPPRRSRAPYTPTVRPVTRSMPANSRQRNSNIRIFNRNPRTTPMKNIGGAHTPMSAPKRGRTTIVTNTSLEPKSSAPSSVHYLEDDVTYLAVFRN